MIPTHLVFNFINAYFITIIIESIIVYSFHYFLSKSTHTKFNKINELKNFILLGIVPSTLTLPYLWFVWSFFFKNIYIFLISGETLVIIIESLLLRLLSKYSLKVCIIVSLSANIGSYFLGHILFMLQEFVLKNLL